MALNDAYATVQALKTRFGISDTTDDASLSEALSAASRTIERFCRRQFNDAGSATARTFFPLSKTLAHIHDFHTVTGLVVKTDASDSGTFDTTWSSTDYQLEPLDGIRDGVTGWPYWKIRAVFTQYFYDWRRASLQVTARWGWSTVPAPVKESCLILAEEIWKTKDAPFGVAGVGDFGPIRVRNNPKVQDMLMPYRRDAVRVK
jgi:hypothetical protein